MTKTKISCILFDFDGVLIDSLPAMEVAWQSIQKTYKINQKFDNYKKYIGLPFNEILFKLNIKQNLHKSIKEKYSKITSQNKKLIKLNPYVKDTLEWLKKILLK